MEEINTDAEGQSSEMKLSVQGLESHVAELRGCNFAGGVGNVPYIASMNVNKSVGVHIGTKLVSITQNVQNTEGVRGRVFGLELMSANSSKRLRCSVAVFVCWALVVASGLGFFLLLYYLRPHVRLDIGLNASWYLRRANWQALPHYAIEFRSLPVKYVVIGHTVTSSCDDEYSCTKIVMAIQNMHLKRRFDDIGPNYLVGGEGIIFEGRGANVVGAMVPDWNTMSITIMFIGDYSTKHYPNQKQFDHLTEFFKVLVAENILDSDYVIYGHCQVATLIISPGKRIMNSMGNFSHWNDAHSSLCLSN